MKIKITISVVLSFLLLYVNDTRAQESNDRNWESGQAMVLPSSTGRYASLPQQFVPYINPGNLPRLVTTAIGSFLVHPNIRVHPSNNAQAEVDIKTNPVNPLIMYATAITPLNIGAYVTTDGGVSWYGSDTTPSPTRNYHIGDPAITIDKNGAFIIVFLGPGGAASNYSLDTGKTFSINYIIPNSGNADKNLAWTDNVPSSPFYGRSYAAWSESSSTFTIDFSFTGNNGISWSNTIPISPASASGYTLVGADGDVGPNGEVYVVWSKSKFQSATEDSLGFAKSTDGGVSWFNKTNGAAHMNGIRHDSLNSFYPFHVNGFPRISVDKTGGLRNGWIYVVGAEKAPLATDSADIYLFRSKNGGVIWDPPIRVNQDTPGNGKLQWIGAVNVDQYGGVNVVYYDNRNTSNDSAEIYVSRSIDGGDTWADILASDHRFKPKSIPGEFSWQGDYIGITSGNNQIWPLWADDITGNYQAWTTSIQIAPVIIHTVTGNIPSRFSLLQNYPNPFNPVTDIKFEIPNQGFVKLVVYDVLGNEVITLVNEVKTAGVYNVRFDAGNLASGIYFYRIESGSFKDVKKMVVLK